MVLFNTESKPAREGALNVLQNMDPQIQTAVPKYSGNLLESAAHAHSNGGSQSTLPALWPYPCSGLQLSAFFTSTHCLWKQEVIKFGSPSLTTGSRWQPGYRKVENKPQPS